MLGRAGEEGQRKRLEAAKNGEVTWLPPPGLGKPDTAEEAAKRPAKRGEGETKHKVGEDDAKVLDSLKKRAGFTSMEDEDL